MHEARRRASGTITHIGGVTAAYQKIPASDGYPLAVTTYEPHEDAGQKVLLVGSSLGGDRRRYAAFARFLAHRGWTVVTFDYRGIGESAAAHAEGLSTTIQDWGEKDVAGLIDWVVEHWQPRRFVALGHSISGQVFGLAPNHHHVDGLLLVASQAGYWRLRPGLWKYLTLGFFTALPLIVKLRGDLPLWPLGYDHVPRRVALDWRRWCLRPEHTDADGRPLRPRFEAFTSPILALSFADDPLYAPRAAVEALLAMYANAPIEHRHYHPRELGHAHVGHRGFFRPGLCPTLWSEALEWLEAPRLRTRATHPRPSPGAQVGVPGYTAALKPAFSAAPK